VTAIPFQPVRNPPPAGIQAVLANASMAYRLHISRTAVMYEINNAVQELIC
jgi:hypothetical protein